MVYMKKNALTIAVFLLLALLTACTSSTDASDANENNYTSRVDTLVVKDTLVIQNVNVIYDTLVLNSRDTIFSVDTIYSLDTLIQLDTLLKLDSLTIRDSLVINDTLTIYDTLVQSDTVYSIDSLFIRDSLIIKDTLVIRDTIVQKDTLINLDTLVKIDTVVVKDSLIIKDTVVHVDTLYIDSSVYKSPVHDAVGYFVKIRDIFYGLKENEKVTFFIRHAERGDDTSENGGLNDNGKEQSRALGQTLAAFDDIHFQSSHFKRAAETCQYIAEGKGQANFVNDTIRDFYDAWYVKDATLKDQYKSDAGGGWQLFSRWAYTTRYSDAFKNIDEASQELIDNYLAPSYDEMPKYTIAASHDQLLVPFVAWATNYQVDLRYYDTKKWLNYLAGVAIIVNENGHVRYVPVYPDVGSLTKGTM